MQRPFPSKSSSPLLAEGVSAALLPLRNLSNDIDIIIGVPAQGDPNAKKGQFTIQAEPTNQFLDDWERFVTIKGGEYFFFPSLTALNYLSTI